MPDGITKLLRDFDPTLPLAKARTIPATWYTTAALFERERQTVFALTWQMVGRSEQLVRPGDYLTTSLAGWPMIVLKNEQGELRAFDNICRHRAAPLLNEPCGNATKLRCRYHGWTYDLAGQLRGTPEFDGVEDFAKADNALPTRSVAEWGGFVWVRLAPRGEPLRNFLAPLCDRDSFGSLVWHSQRTYELRCNWKVYIDNYLDGGYHVNTLHPALAGVVDYAEYKTTTHGNTALQASPLKAGTGAAGATRTGSAEYWWVYPNVMFNTAGSVLDTNRVVPLAVDRCRVEFDFYFAPDATSEFIEQSISVADQVQAEDAEICEQVQRGLTSGGFHAGRYSVKRENAAYEFHRLLHRSLVESRPV